MTKKEALKIIKERLIVDYSKLNEKEIQELDDALDMAIDALKNSDNNWIPVTEKLPDLHEEVYKGIPAWDYVSDEYLITTLYSDGPHVEVGHYSKDSAGWEWPDGGSVEDVIAWKPLPNPYKGE